MSANTNYECDFKEGTSSFIKGFNYNCDTQELTVNFANNKAYKYFEVPHTLCDELLLAESKGKFLHEKLKDKFEGEAILT